MLYIQSSSILLFCLSVRNPGLGVEGEGWHYNKTEIEKYLHRIVHHPCETRMSSQFRRCNGWCLSDSSNCPQSRELSN